jgi:hypothetical protein
MWDRIDAARRDARRTLAPAPVAEPWWSRRQVLWPAAVVAALAIGLTVGRISVGPAPGPATDSDVVAVALSDAATPEAYRLAALPLLQRSEALLLQVRTGAAPEPTTETYGDRAVILLAQTRLLLKSPAAEDTELERLLKDLELALARIVRVAMAPQPMADTHPDRRALEDGLERQAVLPRIRDQLSTDTAAVGL